MSKGVKSTNLYKTKHCVVNTHMNNTLYRNKNIVENKSNIYKLKSINLKLYKNHNTINTCINNTLHHNINTKKI